MIAQKIEEIPTKTKDKVRVEGRKKQVVRCRMHAKRKAEKIE